MHSTYTQTVQSLRREAISKPSNSGISPLIDNITSAKIRYGAGCVALVEKHEQSQVQFAASGPVAGFTVQLEFDYEISGLLAFRSFSCQVEINIGLVNRCV